MSELTEIVIDKKNRYKVYDQISENKKVLGDLINRNRKKEMELKELKLNKC